MQGIARQVFDHGVEVLFDARLRPERDAVRQVECEDALQAGRAGIDLIVAECRAGKYGGVAKQAIETLCRQAGHFIDMEKSGHGLYKPDPQTKRYRDQEVRQIWCELQLTMAQLERLGVDFGDVPEWEVAAVLVSLA